MQTRMKLTIALALLLICPLAFAQQKELIGNKNDAAAPPIPKPNINHEALNKLGLRLGVQAYTFREMSLFETIDVLSAMGVKYIELYPGQKLSKEKPNAKADHNMSQEDLDALIKKLKDSNVTAVNYGVVGLSKDEAASRKVFDWAKKLGLETIVSEPATNKETFDVLEKLVLEYNINLAMHDHPKPSPYWNPDTVLMVSEGRSKKIGSCSDTGHWVRSGLVPVECLKKLEGRVISAHLKDINDKKADVPWGTGIADAKGIMAELKRQGTHNQVFSIEYESSHGSELIANVAKCCENFSKFAEELNAGK